MKKYFKEIIIILLQLFMFYIFPLFTGPTDAMGMVVVIIFATFLLSMIIAILSNENIKFIYPIIISTLFIPSVFIYYNSTALIHTTWYLVISYIGILVGTIIRFCFLKLKKVSTK